MEWSSWLWGWSFWLLVYALAGFILTEIAMWMAEKLGAVTPETHPIYVRSVAYIIHFVFWPLFMLMWVLPGKKDKK